MGVPNPHAIPLNIIERKISVASFSALHPIYKIVSDLKGYKVDSVYVKIQRNLNQSIPMYGRELYLDVTSRTAGCCR